MYIGSTAKTLIQRYYAHQNYYKNWLENKNNFHYYTSFEILCNNNHKIELVEEYPCKSKKELEIRERYWIETIECVNKTIPQKSEQEKKEKHKLWYINNKEHNTKLRKKIKKN